MTIRDPSAPRVLFFTLTDIEHQQLAMLVGYGEQLVAALKGRPPLENELYGRALAFLGGLDPEKFGRDITDATLKLDVVPAFFPCPTCTGRRVAIPGAPDICKDCGGRRMVPTILPPQDRLHTEAQMKVRAIQVAPPPGVRKGAPS